MQAPRPPRPQRLHATSQVFLWHQQGLQAVVMQGGATHGRAVPHSHRADCHARVAIAKGSVGGRTKRVNSSAADVAISATAWAAQPGSCSDSSTGSPRGCAGPAAETNHPRQRNRSRHWRRLVRRGDGKHCRNIEASKEAPQERRHPAALLARTRRQWSHLQELLSDHAHQAKDEQRETNNINKI